MYKILSKYNFITILPFEETFFYTTTLPKNIKFTPELLKINYLKHSPYKNPNILNILQNKELMLWFYKDIVDAPIVVPESYLLFKELKKQSQDAIYIFEGELVKVLLIKNSKLFTTFTLKNIDDTVIELSKDEYQISKVVKLNTQQYEDLKQKALQNLSLKELVQLNQTDLDKKTLLKRFIDKASYPLSALVILAILVSYMQGSFLNSKVDDLTKTYLAQKEKNKEIKKYIKEHNSQVKKWKGFIEKELVHVGSVSLIESIYSILKDGEKAHLTDISINGDKMLLKIQTDMNAIVFLNRLNEVKYFSRVVIQNTYKPRNDMKIISYDIDIKKLKDI